MSKLYNLISATKIFVVLILLTFGFSLKGYSQITADRTINGMWRFTLSSDGTLTITLPNAKEPGEGGLDKDRNASFVYYYTDKDWKWVWRQSAGSGVDDIRPYVKKIIFKANAKGAKFNFNNHDISYMFYGFENLEEIDFSGAEDSYVKNVRSLFQNCPKLKSVDLSWMMSDGSTNATQDMVDMFNGCYALEEVILNNPGFVTRASTLDRESLKTGDYANNSGGVQMQRMFQSCSSLKKVDMSNITINGRKDWTQFSEMFKNNTSLEEVYFNNTKFPNVTDFSSMFEDCTNLRIAEFTSDVPGMAPEALTMNKMFKGCMSLVKLDVSGLGELDLIRNMDGFVSGCTSLETLIIDNLDNSHIGPHNPQHNFWEAANPNFDLSAGVREFGRDLGIKTCTSLKTLSAKNSKVWMCNNETSRPGSHYFYASNDSEVYYFTKKQTKFVSDAGPTVTIETKRNYVDLITDRDGSAENLPTLNFAGDIPDRTTNINIKDGDLNTNGPGFLPPGIYNISDDEWTEYPVPMEASYYRIAYIHQSPYEVSGSHPDLYIFNDGDDTWINTKNKSDWPTSGSYVIDLSSNPIEVKYKNAAVDANGKLYDVIIKFKKITFKDLEKIPERPDPDRAHNDGNQYVNDYGYTYYRNVIKISQGDGLTMNNAARGGDPNFPNSLAYNHSILTGGAGTDIEFEVSIDGANENSSFIFYGDDLDVPYSQNWDNDASDACLDKLTYNNITYGLGGESFILGDGNDISSLRFAPHTGLVLVNGNTVVTTGPDPSTSWSEFTVAANAKGANYTWTSGISCNSYALRDTKVIDVAPLYVDSLNFTPYVEKVLENGTLQSGDFEFVLEKVSVTPENAPQPIYKGTLPHTVAIGADGKAVFSELIFAKEIDNGLIYEPDKYYPGTAKEGNTSGQGQHNTFTYIFKVYEKIPAVPNPNITYDNAQHEIKLVVETPENDAELLKGIKGILYIDGVLTDTIWSKKVTEPVKITTIKNKVNVVNLVKIWDDKGYDARPADIEGFVTYNFNGKDTTLKTESGKWTVVDSTWTYTFAYPKDATIINWGECTVPTGYDFTKMLQVSDTCYMKNQIQKFDLTVSNAVTGEFGDKTKPFEFELNMPALSNQTINATINRTSQPAKDTVFTFDASGKLKFSLKHDDLILFKSIICGSKYSLTEKEEPHYTVSSSVQYNDGSPKTDAYTDNLVPEHTMISDHNVAFVNETEEPEYVEIVVSKKWDDNHNQDGKRMSEVKVYLIDGIAKLDSAMLNFANTWSHSFGKHLRFRNGFGEEIVYAVNESLADDTYQMSYTVDTSVVSGIKNYEFEIVNRHDPETIEFEIEKIWNDSDDLYNLRPANITIKLLADDNPKETVELSASNTWKHKFVLPKYDDGEIVTYTLEEVEVYGYITDIVGNQTDGFTITNTLVQSVDVPGLVVHKLLKGRDWFETDTFAIALVPEDPDYPMPANAQTVDGLTFATLVITKDSAIITTDTRKGSFLPIEFSLNDMQGDAEKTFVYHIREMNASESGIERVTGVTYSSERYEVDVTLAMVSGELKMIDLKYYPVVTDITGNKVRGSAVDFALITNSYNDSVTIYHMVADKQLTVLNLDETLQDGDFKFVLRPVGKNANLAPMPANSVGTGINRTDTTINEGNAVRFYNETLDGDGLRFDYKELRNNFTDAQLLAGLKFDYEIFEVIPDNAVFDEQSSGAWIQTITASDGTIIDEYYDGVVHSRTINVKMEEIGGYIVLHVVGDGDDNPDYYVKPSGDTVFLPNEGEMYNARHGLGCVPIFRNAKIARTSVNVQKIWDDYENALETRPASVTVTLYADGAKSDSSVVLSQNNDWKHTFKNLPTIKINDDRISYSEISYSVKENAVNHYAANYSYDEDVYSIENVLRTYGGDAECTIEVDRSQLSDCPEMDCLPFTDTDDNEYSVVKIGGYCWMAENLRREVDGAMKYSSSQSPDADANASIYGMLYTWQAAVGDDAGSTDENVRGICPNGWHLPTTKEINVLRTNNFEQLAATGLWIGVNATNESGFGAKPAGYFNAETQRFEGLFTNAFFIAAAEDAAFGFEYFCCELPHNLKSDNNAYSVRCVKDCE